MRASLSSFLALVVLLLLSPSSTSCCCRLVVFVVVELVSVRPIRGSINDTRKRRVSCILYHVSCIIHTRWALKNTRYIHEFGGFFQFNGTKRANSKNRINNLTTHFTWELVIHYRLYSSTVPSRQGRRQEGTGGTPPPPETRKICKGWRTAHA